MSSFEDFEVHDEEIYAAGGHATLFLAEGPTEGGFVVKTPNDPRLAADIVRRRAGLQDILRDQFFKLPSITIFEEEGIKVMPRFACDLHEKYFGKPAKGDTPRVNGFIFLMKDVLKRWIQANEVAEDIEPEISQEAYFADIKFDEFHEARLDHLKALRIEAKRLATALGNLKALMVHELTKDVRLILDILVKYEELNVIHRDIKLGNILFRMKDVPYNKWVQEREGRTPEHPGGPRFIKSVKVYDLAIGDDDLLIHIAQVEEDLQYVTSCGTGGYIPPEVLEGNDHTPAQDLYALGVCIFKIFGMKTHENDLPRTAEDYAQDIPELYRLVATYHPEVQEEMQKLFNLAAFCIAPQKEDRKSAKFIRSLLD